VIALEKSLATEDTNAARDPFRSGMAGEGDGVPAGEFHPERSFFGTLGGPFGDRQLVIRAAGVSARLAGLSPRQHADLAARYGIFARKEASVDDVDLSVDVRRSPRASFLKPRGGAVPETHRLLARREGPDLLAWSYDWAACAGAEGGAAILAAASEDRVAFDRTIENFLRVTFAHLALRKGGVLLHGAAVVRGGRAFVFFGPSGSGKTTVTLMSRGSRILSDDLVMLVPSGEQGGFVASSVPFRGLLAPQATSDERYPLAGLFRLVQDTTDFLEDVSRPRAVGEIVQSLPFVMEEPDAAERALEVASSLSASAPVKRLHFRKDAGFWKVIENV